MFIPSMNHIHTHTPMAIALSMFHVYSSLPYGYEYYNYMSDYYNHPML